MAKKLYELKTLEWDILNPDRIINLEIKMREEQAIFILEIKKKSGLSINPDIHHSKVFNSGCINLSLWKRLNSLEPPIQSFRNFLNR